MFTCPRLATALPPRGHGMLHTQATHATCAQRDGPVSADDGEVNHARAGSGCNIKHHHSPTNPRAHRPVSVHCNKRTRCLQKQSKHNPHPHTLSLTNLARVLLDHDEGALLDLTRTHGVGVGGASVRASEIVILTVRLHHTNTRNNMICRTLSTEGAAGAGRRRPWG
jgi:hypothetical protein